MSSTRHEIESTVKKKICLVTPTYRFEGYSGQVALSHFIEILEPIINEIIIITGDFKSESNNRIINITPHEDKKLLLKILKYLINQIKISFVLIKISKDIDVVIFFLGSLLTLPIIMAKLLRKKVVVIATGSDSKTIMKQHEKLFYMGKILFSISKILEKINYNLSDMIGITMESESIIHFMGLEKYRAKIVPLGSYFLGSDFKINKKMNERKNIIGYVGRLDKEKGVIELAKAIPLILSKKNDIKFLIVGYGPLMENMKDVLSKAKCLDEVDFVGMASYRKIPEYLNEMRFHILPSHTEAFGGTAIEAMACGAISIANSVGGIPDVIEDGETGFLLKDSQPQTIANKVLDAWSDPKLEKIQKNAKEFVDKTFSYEKAIERCKTAFHRFG